MPKGHYWLIVLPRGKDEVERVYREMATEDETSEAAVEAWILSHPSMVTRQRNREKTANRLRASILYTQECRPSSWRRAKRESEPPTSSRKSRRRK